MNLNRFIIGLALASLVISGCSSKPGEEDGRHAIAIKIDAESQRRIKLTSFRQTNGQSREMSGVKYYHLEYELTIEFSEDCRWLHHDLLGLSFRTSSPISANPLEQLAYLANPANQGDTVKRYEGRKIAGGLEFERTEKGWRVLTPMPSPTSVAVIAIREERIDERNLRVATEASNKALLELEAARAKLKALKGESP